MRWTTFRTAAVACVLGGALAAPALAWQAPIFKCQTPQGVTYSSTPCPGAKVINEPPQRTRTERTEPTPQDRARAANRAQLDPERRQECEELEALIVREEAALRAKGAQATADDERPLVQARLRLRDLRCRGFGSAQAANQAAAQAAAAAAAAAGSQPKR
ncbi:DUF4124 domain-containing protein [Ramlibacter sp.]|uniref:DUF4124 domain-containing protein n=1 Tax=Ramlibacter sp. TaxID=1917967 RepID=UPI0035B2F85E